MYINEHFSTIYTDIMSITMNLNLKNFRDLLKFLIEQIPLKKEEKKWKKNYF